MKFGLVFLFLLTSFYIVNSQSSELELAKQFYNNQKYNKSIYHLSLFLNDNPKNTNALYLRGLCYEQTNDALKAITDYELVTNINNQHSEAYLNKALLYMDLKNYDQAIKDFNHLLYNHETTESTNAVFFKSSAYGGVTSVHSLYDFKCDILNLRGLCYLNILDFDKALEDFNRALSMDSNNPDYYVNRGLTYMELDSTHMARLDFQKAIELQPDHQEALYNHSLLENKPLSQELFNESFPYSYSKRAYKFFKSGEYQKALEDYNKALEIDPANALDYNNRGLIKTKLKDLEGAILDFKKSIELNANLIKNYLHIGNAYFDLKEFINADQYYDLYLLFHKENPRAYYNAGLCKAELNKIDEACKHFRTAVELEFNAAKKPFNHYCED
ncbi:MAG TPA: tetratricopeptide repeat protein [Cyclobacteriaceae bacterium]